MIKINKLKTVHAKECSKLIKFNSSDEIYFRALGWSENQIISQFNKSVNYSIGIFNNNNLIAFLLGDLIYVEKVSEYEILFLYVKTTLRNRGLASELINNILTKTKKLKLKKIFLEVSEDNYAALKLYKKNNFKLFDVRKNYYSIDKEKINALCFKKII